MIGPRRTPSPVSETGDINPQVLSLITSPTIFPNILSFIPRSNLSTCLRVSSQISHMAASILYRDVALIHVLPPAIVSPRIVPDTRSPFLQYIRTLRIPPHFLYDPALCLEVITKMKKLETVIVPGDWQGWILRPDPNLPIFAHPDFKHRGLRIIITGLKSPASLINNGLLQSDLLSQASEVVLSIDQLNPVYRGLWQRSSSAMGGLRYSNALPSCVKRLTVLLPVVPAIGRRKMRPAGFDMSADSGLFHAPLALGVEVAEGTDVKSEKEGPDISADLARLIWGQKDECEVVVVMKDGRESGGLSTGSELSEKLGEMWMEALERLEEMKGSVAWDEISGRQGFMDGTASPRGSVKWVLYSEWEGRDAF